MDLAPLTRAPSMSYSSLAILSFPSMRALRHLALAAFALSACSSAERSPVAEVGGSVIVAIPAEPEVLLPPLVRTVPAQQVSAQIFEPLAEIGEGGYAGGDTGFRPALAERWSWAADSLSIAFHLDPRARWHDGSPLRARDVRFTYDMYTDSVVGSPIRGDLALVDSVTIPDSLTAVVWFARRYPDQFYDATSRMLIIPEHLLRSEPRAQLASAAFNREPVGSGRFRFARWVPTQSIELVADTANHRGRPKLDRIVFSVTPSGASAATRLAAREVDVLEVSNAADVRALEKADSVAITTLPAWDYTYIQFNFRDPDNPHRPHPLFASRELRTAIALALDRNAMIRNTLASLGSAAEGPMTSSQAMADTTVELLPFDTARASHLLDSLGWRIRDGERVRERNGRRLSFRALVPSPSRNRMAMAVHVQEALSRIGVELKLDPVDGPAWGPRLAARNFDVAFNGARVDLNVSGLRQSWGTAAARNPKGGNFSSYENAEFDAHVDSALAAPDLRTGRRHASEAYRRIVADVPAIWMYEARTGVAVDRRIRTVRMLPHAWWAGMAEWSIPADRRIDRDRAGLRVATK